MRGWMVVLLAACGGDKAEDSAAGTGTGTGGADLSACAGDFTGTYSGDDAGVVFGELLADGTLNITFGTSFGDVSSSGQVAADGAVSGSDDGVSISGTYDFASCSAEGTWVNALLGASGDWQLAKS